MSKPCPTDAAACWVGRSFGREFNFSGASPAAMAPEETRATSAPRDLSDAITPTIFSTDAESSCEPAVPVREEEPIFKTMRLAEVIAVRSILLLLSITFYHFFTINNLNDLRRMRIFYVVLPLLCNFFITELVNLTLWYYPC